MPLQAGDFATTRACDQQKLDQRRRVWVSSFPRLGFQRIGKACDFFVTEKSLQFSNWWLFMPLAGLSDRYPRATAKVSKIDTSVTHCAATPPPPVGRLPGGSSNSSAGKPRLYPTLPPPSFVQCRRDQFSRRDVCQGKALCGGNAPTIRFNVDDFLWAVPSAKYKSQSSAIVVAMRSAELLSAGS